MKIIFIFAVHYLRKTTNAQSYNICNTSKYIMHKTIAQNKY